MATYRDMWVFCESHNGRFLPISLEMLGESRRLMDKYNRDYRTDEKVVAVVLGPRARELGAEAIQHGADVAFVAEHPELSGFRLMPCTRVTARAATMKEENGYDKPRYFLFPATHNGRDLSATVLAVLESGLASDCNLLYIEDVDIKHPVKTAGQVKRFERILHMKRPDFSGFEWSTILCLDNPAKEYHPQACSVIPGSFKPLPRDATRKGDVREIPVELGANDLRVKVVSRQPVKKGVDLTKAPVVVALGRGIGDDPTRGFQLGLELARLLEADIGLSRGVVTASYKLDGSVAQYLAEERQIGETGQSVKPKVYVALGISGAIQHKKGMDQSAFIVTINSDEAAPIREFSDVYVIGDLFEAAPRLIQALQKAKGGA